jgi:hypothetical protein
VVARSHYSYLKDNLGISEHELSKHELSGPKLHVLRSLAYVLMWAEEDRVLASQPMHAVVWPGIIPCHPFYQKKNELYRCFDEVAAVGVPDRFLGFDERSQGLDRLWQRAVPILQQQAEAITAFSNNDWSLSVNQSDSGMHAFTLSRNASGEEPGYEIHLSRAHFCHGLLKGDRYWLGQWLNTSQCQLDLRRNPDFMELVWLIQVIFPFSISMVYAVMYDNSNNSFDKEALKDVNGQQVYFFPPEDWIMRRREDIDLIFHGPVCDRPAALRAYQAETQSYMAKLAEEPGWSAQEYDQFRSRCCPDGITETATDKMLKTVVRLVDRPTRVDLSNNPQLPCAFFAGVRRFKHKLPFDMVDDISRMKPPAHKITEV